jgi:hypothetical protein
MPFLSPGKSEIMNKGEEEKTKSQKEITDVTR